MRETIPTIILASGSPRRAEMLRALGLLFDIEPAAVDERHHRGEAPVDYARRVAADKAVANAAHHPDAFIIGADTVVVVESHVLGKPKDTGDARRMLRLLRDRTHEVITAVALRSGGRTEIEHCATKVTFRPMTASEVDWYVDTGEPMDKAGAYGIQGAASLFIDRIEGSWANVVGMPIHVMPALFQRFGVEFMRLIAHGDGVPDR